MAPRFASVIAVLGRQLGSLLLACVGLVALACNGDGAGSLSSDADPDGEPRTDVRGSLEPREEAWVFFSGHSLLDNPMPDWIETIGASRGHAMGWNQQIVIGSPIRFRTIGDDPRSTEFAGYRLGRNREGEGMDVAAELRSPATLTPGARYDTLLITERNDPLGTIQHERTAELLRHFHDRLIEGNPDGRTLFYQVWPAMDKADPEAWIVYVRAEIVAWECVAAKVNLSLDESAQPGRVWVVPGGIALAALVESALNGEVPGIEGDSRGRLDRILSDDVHLTELAIYYLAALHYGAIFGQSAEGAAVPEAIDPETGRFLQALAWSVLTEYHAGPTERLSMAECRRRLAALCPMFWTIHERPENAARCDFWTRAEEPRNPFRWPDPGWPNPPTP